MRHRFTIDWRDAWRSLRADAARHGDRRPLARARHRRQYGALLDPQQPDAQVAPGARPAAARACSAETTGPTRSGSRFARTNASSRDGAFAWAADAFDLSQGGPTDLVEGIWASGRMFDVLGVSTRRSAGRSPRPTMRAAADRTAPSRSSATASGSGDIGGAADVIGRSADDPARALHDRRHHAAGILRARRRPLVRRRHPDRGRATGPRRRELARRPIDLVAEHHGCGSSPGRAVEQATGAAARPPAADSAGDRCLDDWKPEDQAGYLEEPFTLHARARPVNRRSAAATNSR